MKALSALLVLFALLLTKAGAEPLDLKGRRLPGPLRSLGPIEAVPADAGNRFDAATWRRVKTYEMQALQAIEPLPLRQIVGVRFNYRNADITHWKPNWYQSSIWRYERQEQDRFDYIQVVVAKADVDAFKALPSEFRAGRAYVVYGEVLKDADSNFIFLRLIGTKVSKSARGAVTVTW